MPTEAISAPRATPPEFRVDLDMFRGPLDLLLYLVRKQEFEIAELPIAPIVDQYLSFLEALEQIDVNAAADFLEMASTLAEIKSRQVLPRADEVEDALDDPRRDLVRQLLEYKKYKDAASLLEERARGWQERFPRLANDLPARPRDLTEEPIHDLELWDLVSAFTRLMRDRDALRPANIIYDETPIHVYMSNIHGQLIDRGRLAFSELFAGGMHKSSLVSLFLAMMELVRHHGARAEQDQLFGEIWLYPGENQRLNLDQVDDYTRPAPPDA